MAIIYVKGRLTYIKNEEDKKAITIAFDEKFKEQLKDACDELASEVNLKKYQLYIQEGNDTNKEYLKGLAYLNAKTIFDIDCYKVKDDILYPIKFDNLYSGCYVTVAIKPYYYTSKETNTKGIAFGLQGIIFEKDGEKITNNVFSDLGMEVADDDKLPF